MPHLESRADVDVAQARALTQLLAAHQVTNRQTWAGAEPQLALGSFGPSLWSLLDRALAAGVVLVPGKDLRSVRFADRPARVTLDVSEAAGPEPDDPDGPDGTATARLSLGVAVEDVWHPGDRVEVLAPVAGASRVTAPTGHGVAVWEGEPGLWDVLLAPVERPIGTKVARALKGGDRFAVPAEEVERLTTDYLPRLQRHLPVASSDESVHVPELPRPRLALAVHWRAVDEVALTWSWRYRVGSDDRVYGLADTRGLRGIRAPEQEAELLAGLELDDAQTYRLCGGRRGARSAARAGDHRPGRHRLPGRDAGAARGLRPGRDRRVGAPTQLHRAPRAARGQLHLGPRPAGTRVPDGLARPRRS